MEQTTPYKLKKSAPRDLAVLLESIINSLFSFLSLKNTSQFWGVVYDSVSKQPLDPVIVKLIYADGREAETCVTDLNGGYGFLAHPGSFKIFARKANYTFPSTRITGSSDGIYENLYHGEFFELTGDSEVVAPNIPMDPTQDDWNQQAKSQIYKKYPFLKLLLKRLVATAFWFGFIFLGIAIWRSYPDIPRYFWAIVIAYISIILLSIIISGPRLFGKIISSNRSLLTAGLLLELHNSKFPEITFGKCQVREDGKFLLRAGRGKYLLMIFDARKEKEKKLLAALPVKVGKSGVVNSTFHIK